jgi:hypothetical protein
MSHRTGPRLVRDCAARASASAISRRALGAAFLAASVTLLLAGSASASFEISSFDGSVNNRDGSPATQAGAHPYDATTTIHFPIATNGNGEAVPDGQVKDIQVDLPAGFVGNPTAVPMCTEAELESQSANPANRCPDDSAVGVVTLFNSTGFNAEVPLFNMVAPPGVPGEFGLNFLGVPIHLSASVRPSENYALRIDIANIAQALPIVGTSLTLWGNPADPSHDEVRGSCLGFGGPTGSLCPFPGKAPPFLTNPTLCAGPVTTTLRTDSWQQPGVWLQKSFVSHDNAEPSSPIGPTGCDRVPFAPSLSVRPDSPFTSAPSGYSVTLHVPQTENPDGLAQAGLKKAVVTMPAGVSVSPSAADGLGACSPQQIGLGNSQRAACPDASNVGSVEIDTPLLASPMKGAVYLAQQGANPFGSLLALYLVAEGSGVVVKLSGQVTPDPVTGQLTATFDENPQLPFTDLKLHFDSGPRAALSNPPTCGAYTTSAQLTSWSARSVQSDSSFAINQAESGGPCSASAFAPSFTAGTAAPQAGAFSPFTLTLSRADQDQTLGAVSVRMPPGLLGVIKNLVQCPEPQASSGTCGAESEIGRTTVAAGAGSSPFWLGGEAFLTGPYKGAPFGLSVVVPAIAGPFNLGTVVVRAAISVDPHTAQITVTSDPLPTILQGIPLQLRTVNVTIDRSGFTFNPTNCSPMSVTGTIASNQGASAAVSTPFQAANCANLPFKPKFSASTGGKASKASGASLDVKVASKGGPQPGGGEANIRSVRVQLPLQLPSRLTTLQKACVDSVFEANPASCPAASNVGSATASTPVLAHPLSGPAYLVSHGGAAFPDLEVVLQGEGITLILDGQTNIKKGITTSTFNTVPDAPISSFELKLPTGKFSVLTANLPEAAKYNFCGKTLAMPTLITGQNGAVVKQSTKIAVSGCPRAKKAAKQRAKKAGKGRRATHGNGRKA